VIVNARARIVRLFKTRKKKGNQLDEDDSKD
jgi:hypothetical protein